MEEKKRRIQLTKEQKRLLAEHSKAIAFAEEEKRRSAARTKSERLRALRAQQTNSSGPAAE